MLRSTSASGRSSGRPPQSAPLCRAFDRWLGYAAREFRRSGDVAPRPAREWQAAGFFILGLMSKIANIASAWMTPAYAAELLDEE